MRIELDLYFHCRENRIRTAAQKDLHKLKSADIHMLVTRPYLNSQVIKIYLVCRHGRVQSDRSELKRGQSRISSAFCTVPFVSCPLLWTELKRDWSGPDDPTLKRWCLMVVKIPVHSHHVHIFACPLLKLICLPQKLNESMTMVREHTDWVSVSEDYVRISLNMEESKKSIDLALPVDWSASVHNIRSAFRR